MLTVVKGLGHSLMSQKYSIRDLNEARDYLKMDNLRKNLLEITQALLNCNGNITNILGHPDDLKLCSCMTLFEFVAPEIKEFSQVLDKFYNGKRCTKTINILKREV